MTALVLLLAALPLAGTAVALLGAHSRVAGYTAVAGACGSLALAIWLLVYIGDHKSLSGLSGFVLCRRNERILLVHRRRRGVARIARLSGLHSGRRGFGMAELLSGANVLRVSSAPSPR